jgi:biotin operon repressor
MSFKELISKEQISQTVGQSVSQVEQYVKYLQHVGYNRKKYQALADFKAK